jgi:hypothetical protein
MMRFFLFSFSFFLATVDKDDRLLVYHSYLTRQFLDTRMLQEMLDAHDLWLICFYDAVVEHSMIQHCSRIYLCSYRRKCGGRLAVEIN